MICLNRDDTEKPDWLDTEFLAAWSYGQVRFTAPIQGFTLTSYQVADDLCATLFGYGYRMADLADGINENAANLHAFWSLGYSSRPQRFWIASSEHPANPWD